MADDRLPNTTGNPVLDHPDTAVTTAPDLLTPEELQLQRLARLSHEVGRLYAWLGLLTGISVLSLGLLTGFALWLKTQNNQLQQQLAALNTYKAEIGRVTQLEGRLNALETQSSLINQNLALLNQQIPKDLPTQLKTIQSNIGSLKTQIQGVESNTVTRQQMEQSIQKAIQDQNKPAIPLKPSKR